MSHKKSVPPSVRLSVCTAGYKNYYTQQGVIKKTQAANTYFNDIGCQTIWGMPPYKNIDLHIFNTNYYTFFIVNLRNYCKLVS